VTTAALIQYIRGSWWVWLFAICMTSYVVYSFIKDHLQLKELRDRKKALEGELAVLEAQYKEKVDEFEAKVKERKQQFNRGKK
jgi:hypothetical protein